MENTRRFRRVFCFAATLPPIVSERRPVVIREWVVLVEVFRLLAGGDLARRVVPAAVRDVKI